MSWQEEVRRLDEDLAAGRISADEHQQRREELTAQGSTAQGGTGQGSTATQDSPADSQAGAPNSPFPPAFRWESTPPNETTPNEATPNEATPNETTQVITPVGGEDNESAERTQIVHNPRQSPPGPSYDDSERTQVVQAGPLQPPPYSQPGYPQPQYPGPDDDQPSWAQQESAPPWMSSDLPPVQEPNPGWMMHQGPEFVEPEKNKDSGVVRIVAIAAAVVVLAGIAFGTWFLFGRGGSGQAQPQQPTQQQSAAPAPPPPVDPLAPADVGGSLEYKQVTSFQDVQAAAFLTTDEEDDLTTAGAGASRLLVSNFRQGKATILVTQVTSPATAATALKQLASLQVGYGFSPRTGPAGVQVFEVLDKSDVPPTLRALYVSSGRIVRVEMRGNSPGEASSGATAKFEQVLAQQLEKLPADA
ncbi:MAG TPA: hypothetical protein VGJ13_16360 [Pseudonocardiaceae bacterium]